MGGLGVDGMLVAQWQRAGTGCCSVVAAGVGVVDSVVVVSAEVDFVFGAAVATVRLLLLLLLSIIIKGRI